MAVTFDGPNTTILLPSTGVYNVEEDLYSEWKDWVATGDNAKYLKAFDTSGGDDIGGGQSLSGYFFLRTDYGWIIKAPEEDGDVIIEGNLFPRVAGESVYEAPNGPYTVLITQSQSISAITVNTGSGGGSATVENQDTMIAGINQIISTGGAGPWTSSGPNPSGGGDASQATSLAIEAIVENIQSKLIRRK